MRRFIHIVEAASDFGAALSALFMVLIVLLIGSEIVLRSLFNLSTLISDEYSAYFFVAMVLLGLAFTLKEEGHIRITLITSMVGKKAELVLEVIATLTAIALIFFAIYYSSIMVYDSWYLDIQADSISETPIYLTQMVIPVGLVMLEFQLVARLLKRFL